MQRPAHAYAPTPGQVIVAGRDAYHVVSVDAEGFELCRASDGAMYRARGYGHPPEPLGWSRPIPQQPARQSCTSASN